MSSKDQIEQFKKQATKLTEQEISQKYYKAPQHLQLGKKHWQDVWKRMTSLSSRVQIYDHPMKYQPILDYLWQSYAELVEQTNHILEAYGETGKEIVHSDEYDSDEEPVPPPVISRVQRKTSELISQAKQEKESAAKAKLEKANAITQQNIQAQINSNKGQTGWSKPDKLKYISQNIKSTEPYVPHKLPNASNNPYTYINPNIFRGGQNRGPSPNQIKNAQGFPHMPPMPANLAPPTFPNLPGFGQLPQMNNSPAKIFTNPNFNAANLGVKIPKTQLRVKGKLVDISSSSDSSDSSDSDDSGINKTQVNAVAGNLPPMPHNFGAGFGGVVGNNTASLDLGISAEKWQEYVTDPEFSKPLQRVEVDTEQLTPFILAAKDYYEISHDEQLLDELLELIEKNQTSTEILVQGWMADLYIDFLGSNCRRLDVEKFRRKREMEKVKKHMGNLDLEFKAAADPLESIDMEDIKHIMKQVASGEKPSKRKVVKSNDSKGQNPEFQIDESDSDSENEEGEVKKVKDGIDSDETEILDYGKHVKRSESEPSEDSDDDMLLTAEDMLKQKASRRKQRRQKNTKRLQEKILNKRQKISKTELENTKNITSSLANLSNAFGDMFETDKNGAPGIDLGLEDVEEETKKVNSALDQLKETMDDGILTAPEPNSLKRKIDSSMSKITISNQENSSVPKALKDKQRKLEKLDNLTNNLLNKEGQEISKTKPEKEATPAKRSKIVVERQVYRPKPALEYHKKFSSPTNKKSYKSKYADIDPSKLTEKQLKRLRKEERKEKRHAKRMEKLLHKEKRKITMQNAKNMRINVDKTQTYEMKKDRIVNWLTKQTKTNQEVRQEIKDKKVKLTKQREKSTHERRKIKNMMDSMDVSLKGGVFLDSKPQWDQQEDSNMYSLEAGDLSFLNNAGDRKKFLIDQMEKITSGRKLASYGDVEF